ncbi:MAG: 2,3-bisphosphoglycerate-independent phosphoglycerate mutase, partial [Patescibacteria group bacterium]
MAAKKTLVLIILDGWGLGAENESNPIHMVNPETFRWLADNYPVTSLQASGISVGLPWGEVGNSEVGHLTIGAGKVIYQYYPRIMMAIEDKSFFDNKVLKDACAHAKKNGTAINFAGLFSKANVHAAINHLEALLELAEREGVPAKLHLFADGKDSPPHTILEFLKLVPREKIATFIGRHYAMNRSDNWLLTQKAYECLTGQSGQLADRNDIEKILAGLFARNQSEEHLPPLRFSSEGGSASGGGEDSKIGPGESLVFFNFREDSILQIAQAFAKPGFDKFPRAPLDDLFVATFTRYSAELSSPVAFPAESVDAPLGAVLADNGRTQLRIAESYKHGHVTFFFNGHREEPFPGEYRVLIPSLATTRTEEHPELQAAAITDRLLEAVQNREFDFV